MDARLKIARMTEGEFSFIEAMHLYNFIGPCLEEEIKNFSNLCLLEVSHSGASLG